MSARKPEREGADERFYQFNFLVDLGDGWQGGFQEMSGLGEQLATIDYRSSRDPVFSARKMPGIVPLAQVTLKRGLIVGDQGFREWHQAILLGRIEPRTIRIRQRDEQGQPLMTWTLAGARPTTILGPGPQSSGEEFAIESLELACESIAAAEG